MKYRILKPTGMEMEWEKTMQTRVRRSPRFLTLTSAFEVITLFRALYKNTANNFHWAFVCSPNQ